MDAFRSAIEIDPTYAPAHAGLARERSMNDGRLAVRDRIADDSAQSGISCNRPVFFHNISLWVYPSEVATSHSWLELYNITLTWSIY